MLCAFGCARGGIVCCSLELQRKREERMKEEEEKKGWELSRLRGDLASEGTAGAEHKRKDPMQEVSPLSGEMEYEEDDEVDDEEEEE